MTDITLIFEGLILVVLGILVAFVVPWLKLKIGEAKLNELLFWIKKLVKAAEQIFRGSGLGAKKKQYVIQMLNDLGYTYDETKINPLIESAVKELDIKVGSDESD